tara:strand:- start:2738 stop:3250 length:513 start_codon:yes stop_codon:yes gene_type:complete
MTSHDLVITHGLTYGVFFGAIGFMMIVATSLEFYAAYDLDGVCDDKFVTAPMTAGIALLCSMIANGSWVYGKNSGNALMRRGSILVWTMLVVIGTTAAGAALGQQQLYEDVGCTVEVTEALHYVSIVLLLLSISVPHVLPKKKYKKSCSGSDAGAPLVASDTVNMQDLVW